MLSQSKLTGLRLTRQPINVPVPFRECKLGIDSSQAPDVEHKIAKRTCQAEKAIRDGKTLAHPRSLSEQRVFGKILLGTTSVQQVKVQENRHLMPTLAAQAGW